MTNFINIFNLGTGVAAYQVTESDNHSYNAQLLKNTSEQGLPEQITIAPEHIEVINVAAADPVMEKLVAAIRKAESDKEDLVQ